MSTNKKFKITRDIETDIDTAVAGLPPVAKSDKEGHPMYREALVRGAKLKQADLKEGQVLNPAAMYKVKQLVYENHRDNLVQGVQKEGPGFIKSYVDAISGMQKLAEKQMKTNLFTKIKTTVQSWLNRKN